MSTRIQFARLYDDPPKLHNWNRSLNLGGFNQWMLERLFAFLENAGLAEGGASFVETGAGLSTLMFLCTNPKEVVTCTVEDEAFFGRLAEAAASIQVSMKPSAMHVGRSEVLLPELVLDRDPFSDFALIDGGHGWPTVFVDFCYVAYATRQHGFVALDDTQLYSVAQLAEFLKEQPGWEVALDLGKVIIFRKLYEDRLLPDFGGQPFIKKRSA